MSRLLNRRQYVAGIAATAVVAVAGCTEASEDGTPPSTEDPPDGPVADQNGSTEQEPGLGPSGDSSEGNETALPEEGQEGEGAAPDDPGQVGEDGDGDDGEAGNETGGGGGDDGTDDATADAD